MLIRDRWGRKHIVPDKYGHQDFIIPESRVPETFTVTPNTILSRSAYNFNQASTREEVNRSVTLVNLEPGFRSTGEKIDTKKKVNW